MRLPLGWVCSPPTVHRAEDAGTTAYPESYPIKDGKGVSWIVKGVPNMTAVLKRHIGRSISELINCSTNCQ